MGKNIFTKGYYALLRKYTKNVLQKKLPLIVEVIDDQGDGTSFDIIRAIFTRLYPQLAVSLTTTSDIELLHSLWLLPKFEFLLKQETAPLFLIKSKSTSDYDKTIIKPDFVIALSLDDPTYLERITSYIGSPKKVFVSTKILDKYPESGTKKYSIIDHKAITVELTNSASGSTVSIAGNSLEKHAITFPEVVLNADICPAFEAALLLLSILKHPLDNALVSLENTFLYLKETSGIKRGINNMIILDSSCINNITVNDSLLDFQHSFAKKEKRAKAVVLGNAIQLSRTILKKTDILILTGDTQRKTGIKVAETAGFVLNENLYWFSDGKQLSFHMSELVDDNSVILFSGQKDDYLSLAINELIN